MIGGFGVMDLTLALSPYGVLTLFVDFNNGEAKGMGDLYLKQAGVLAHDYDVPKILQTVEMWNTVANGSGRFWRFVMVGGIDTMTEEEAPAQFTFNINLVPQRSRKMYSKLIVQEEQDRPSYRGAMYISTIEEKLDASALIDSVLREVDEDEVVTSRTDMVMYLRRRNLTNAAVYSPDVGLEETWKRPRTYRGFQ